MVAFLVIFTLINVYISLSRPTIPDEIQGLIVYDDLTSLAVAGPVSYPMTPPAGGSHAAATLECGIYRLPVDNEQAVAALATGAVWIAYDPELPQAEIDGLEDFAEGDREIFMSPYEGLPNPIVVTAWGYQLYPDSSADVRLGSFMRDYKNGPDAPARNLECLQEVTVP